MSSQDRSASRGHKRRPGRPRTTDGPSTEQRILHTAREVFSEQGYERATFKEVAERAGLTRPAVNHYFPGKKALYDAVSESTRSAVVAEGVADAAEQPTLPERLAAFLQTASQVDSKDRSYARFIASSLVDGFRHPELRDQAYSQLDELRQFVEQALHDSIVTGEIRADLDVAAVTEMLVAVMWGMGFYAGFVGTHDQLESVVDQFSRLLDGSLW
jgi:AcrR family transcriptional regulator